jgi:DNA-binding beta-propeller fold protein YncE
VYAASFASSGGVFVINAAACNANNSKGCKGPVRKVKDPLIPDGIAVDVASNTVYAANGGPSGNGNTLSVIDGGTCNGTNHSGCGQVPRKIKVGTNPFWGLIDPATRTLYVANFNDGTVSVINAARCNAKSSAGCPRYSRGANRRGRGIPGPRSEATHGLCDEPG